MRTLFLSVYKKHLTIVALMLALLLLQGTLLAQQTGMISGTVFDSTGAVVAGAKITLVDQSSKATRQTTSNGEGYFAFSGVMPSTYTVKVETKGFKNWSLSQLPLSTGDKKNVSNIVLEVGTSTESISVEATVSQVQVVDSGEKSYTLNSKDIGKLALQGRDVTELIRTVPGFNYSTGLNGYGGQGSIANGQTYVASETGIGSAIGVGFNANGMSRGGIDLQSDGAHVIDPGCNCNATQTINGDMVDEVKVSTSNFSADNSKGPIVVAAVGKSGGAAYHGQAYMHARDGVLNSKEYYLGANPKPEDRYFYPGGQIGGPVRLPFTDFNKHNPKMFFWNGFEYYNQMIPSQTPLEAWVPTDSMRTGDFRLTQPDNQVLCKALNDGGYNLTNQWNSYYSACNGLPVGTDSTKWNGYSFYRDPVTGAQTMVPAGNVLPQEAMDKAGLAIMSMIPHANRTPTVADPHNYYYEPVLAHNGIMEHSRVDYNFSDNTKLYVSYNYQRESSFTPVMLAWQPPESVFYPANMAQQPKSHTFAANLLHVFSPSLTNEVVFTYAYLNIPLVYTDLNAVSRTALKYPDYGTYFGQKTDIMPSLNNSWWDHTYPMMFQSDANNYLSLKRLPTVADNITKIWRTHVIKAGFYFEMTGNKQYEPGYTNGRVIFGMGPFCSNLNGCDTNDWKQTPDKLIGTPNQIANLLEGLSANYYEENKRSLEDMASRLVQFYVTDSWKFNRRLSFDIGARIEHNGAWVDNAGVGAAVFTDQWYKADMALATPPNFPGMRWNAIDSSIPTSGRKVKPVFVSPRLGMNWDVFGSGKTILRGGWGAYRSNDAPNGAVMAPGIGVNGVTLDQAFYLSDLKKISNASTTLLAGGSALSPYDDEQPLTYTYSFSVDQQMPGSSILELSYVGNQSKHQLTGGNSDNLNTIPLGAYFRPDVHGNMLDTGAVNGGWANVVASNYRPYQAYAGGALTVYTHRNYYNYNGLQASWRRQKGWLTYSLNYTWSKSLGIVGSADPINLDANYGVTPQDRSHVIQASYVVDLGSRLHFSNSVLRGVVNGWTLSGITAWQSGGNLEALYNKQLGYSGPIGSSQFLGTPDYTLMPNVICDPTSNLAKGQYINGSCFAPPTLGQNGAFNMPYIHGPAFFNSDLTLYKTFKITERQNLELRVAAFNFLNRANTSFDPNNGQFFNLNLQSSTTSPTGYAPNQDILHQGDPKLYPYGYGFATTKTGRRVVELTLKYSF
jgi:hypothetical protein